ncbi:MAG: carboxypeptidase-like regulatory domain-containing protein [Acidobacteria bacterium]|nr:carboxypeptidase-like regulatory domain-containing protein [Acidobacteriota bacterium]
MRFLLFLGLVGLAWAQDPLVVEGTVVNALSGAPLRMVSVQLYGPAMATAVVVTDATGKFRFVGVKPGRYQLRPERNGFFTDGAADPAVELKAGEGTTAAPIKLWPGGAISGAVLDEEGEPVVGAQVTLSRRAYVGGHRQMVPVANAATDDRGQYRLFGLRQDQYFVRAVAPRVAGQTVLYPPTFYPVVTDVDKASPLVLAAGQEQRGINIALRPTTGFRLAGRVMNGLTNTPLTSTSVSITPRGIGLSPVDVPPTVSVFDAGGKFAVSGVMPGQYDLASNFYYDKRTIQAHLLVDVRRDMEDVVLTLQPGVQLRGRIRVEGEGAVNLSSLRVAIETAEDMIGGGGSARVNAEGGFEIGPLLPMRYSPNLHNLPAGAYLQGVKMGEQEATFDLTAAAGQTIVTVWVVSMKGGKVMGKTAAGAVVALVPAADEALRQSRYRAVEADSEGRYEVTGVGPGRYQVYAFTKVEAGAWMDDTFLAGLADGGVAVKVEEKETKAVDVKAQ